MRETHKILALVALALFLLFTVPLRGEDTPDKEDAQEQMKEKPRPKRLSSSPA